MTGKLIAYGPAEPRPGWLNDCIVGQQAWMGSETDVLALDMVLFKSDGGPVPACRALAAMITAEQAE